MTYYQKNKYSKPFTPRKPVRSFRDLDVYQKSMECAVLLIKDLMPTLAAFGKSKKEIVYSFGENMVNCAMSIPLSIGEAHSMRFASFQGGIALLEKAMSGSNKMIVYLEEIKGVYGAKVDVGFVDDLIRRYADNRTKMFHLEKSWKKFSYPVREVKPNEHIKY